MDYEGAVSALESGDFQRAAEMLGRGAEDADFRSDVLNHLYTLALHHAGETVKLAEVAFRVGNRMLPDDPGSSLDYYQRALVAGLAPGEARQIGAMFERWASRGEAVGGPPPGPGSVRTVAHVVGGVGPGHPRSQYLETLIRSLKLKRIESIVFTTEWASSWFMNPTGPHSQPSSIEAEVRVASIDGDFCERADRIAESIRASDCQVAFFHASLTEQITARVAAVGSAPVQVHVSHDGGMDADLFDASIHLFRHSFEQARFPDRINRWIPPASDIESRLGKVRSEKTDIGGATSTSATFGNLREIATDTYLDSLRAILLRFPSHVHLFAGSGDVRAARSYFHRAEVLSQVRFLGPQTDVAHLLPQIDIYLAPDQNPRWESVLEAMGAGKPVVVRSHAARFPENSCGELVDLDELVVSSEGEFVDIVSRLILDVDYRDAVAQAIQLRFQQEFRPEVLGPRYADFLESLTSA